MAGTRSTARRGRFAWTCRRSSTCAPTAMSCAWASARSLASLDERVLRAARTRWHPAHAERAVAQFSRLGEHGGIWLVLGALCELVDPPRRTRWRSAMASVAVAYGLNTAVKLLVRRRRPRLTGLPALTRTPTRMSFPSAHASTSFAGALAYS